MFDETRLYLTGDPALRAIAPASTMAHWRCENRGPAYIRLGQKIGYSGVDLNAWLAAQRVQTAQQSAAA